MTLTFVDNMKMPRLLGIPALLLLLGALTVQAQHTPLHSFTGGAGEGAFPKGSLTLSGTTLFGMTSQGGAAGKGVIFTMDTDGSGYNTLHAFAGGAGDGAGPYAGSLLLSGTNLYGLTAQGGTGNGVLFTVNKDGSGYTNLHTFTSGAGDGNSPYGSLTMSGTNLYGMTLYGGSNSLGVVFRINKDGSGYTNLHTFTGGVWDGKWPQGALTLSGTNLYGMTSQGGPLDRGVLFTINADGSGYTNLHAFVGGPFDGSKPHGSLTLSGTNLYGMTYSGSSSDLGVVFKINTDGSGYTHLHAFAGGTNDGALPHGSLALMGSTLKGMTSSGGASGLGVLFQVNTDGSGYNLLHTFAGGAGDGAAPYDSLTLLSDSTFYGMTQNGGVSNSGMVFALSAVAVTTAASPTNAGGVTGSGFYAEGNTVQLTAVASNGWLFTGWNDGATNNPYSITVPPTSIAYTANFARASLVTVVASPTNAGSVAGGGNYFVGSNAVLTATASNNWLFLSWTGGVTNNPWILPVPETNATYTATFVATATITAGANTNDGGSVTGSGVFLIGSNAVLAATASNNWLFISWSDGVTNNPRTVVVASNMTYTAVFAPTVLITVLASPPDNGSVTGGGTYVVGSNAVLTATPSNLWRFISWSDSVTNNPRTVVVPSGGGTYTANFSPLGTVVVQASPTNGGSVTGGGLYLIGSNATVTATASNSWRFLNWNGSLTNNPLSFTVASGTATYIANFAALRSLTVLASPGHGGSVTGGGQYVVGSNATLSATASNGWVFTSWVDGNNANPRTIIMPSSNVTYTATFVPVSLSVALGRALNATNLIWQTGGNGTWFPTNTVSRDGQSAQSGAVAGGQQSWIQVVTNGPGSISFWWKLASEISDVLQFSVNGQVQGQLTTSADWQQVAVFLASTNTYTLRWTYAKQAYSGVSPNAGWLDLVTWSPCPYATNAPQVFYQDPTGLLASWVLDSAGGFRFARILSNTGGWALKCAGDVDGDSVSDLLFQNAAGDAAGWFMNADGSTRSARYWFNLSGWDIRACGDYEGIGRGQLFFQNAAGVAAYWRIDTNGNYQAAIPLGSMVGWKLRGAGDLDGDHKAELFWQNAAGTVAIWFHNPDGSIRGAVPFGSTGDWALCGVADIDGDHISDLVWQNSAGQTGGWFMNSNGTARAASYWWGTGAWKLKAAGR